MDCILLNYLQLIYFKCLFVYVRGKIKEPMSDETIRELTNLKVNFEVRHLEVGDFVWVARNGCGKELLLPYIVERKRMDDLGKSIKDGRFHEQKVHSPLK